MLEFENYDEISNFDVELKHVRKILDEYCEIVKTKYKQKLISDNKKATGNLIQSVDTQIIISGTEISVVLNVADYYIYVENGRKPGKFPPINVIKKWIQDKPIIPYENDVGKLPTENQLAFLISRKIARDGIEPGKQLHDTLEECNKLYVKKLQEALHRDFDDYYSLKILEDINSVLTKIF